MKRDLYKITEPSVISFSGGRTSAYMLWRILEVHDGKLPEFAKICFANTGKEMPETLDFVRDCGEKWGVDIVWLERFAREAREDEKNKYVYETRIVDYESASRKGEPFSALVKARRYAPNPVARFCTVDLKIRAISEYLINTCGFEKPYVGFIGIRGDEPRRAKKMNGTVESGQERYLPLYLDEITAQDVCDFWNAQDFDLNLPNNNGVTDWGNCDLCFLKGYSKKQSIIQARPDLADWWIETEASLSEQVGKGAYFRKDSPSYAQMKQIALEQIPMFGFDYDTIPCFCGD
jgi:3'-phosphoadenosine 5'-phosphosulfate sulfotransferase (PAPS reductase)/FAD synthetase